MPVTTLRRRKVDAYGLIAGSPFVAFSQNIATPGLWYASIYGGDGAWKSDIASKTLDAYPSQVLAYYIGHDPLENTADGSLLFEVPGFYVRHRVWDVAADQMREYPTADANQISEAVYADGYVYWIDFGFTGTGTTFKLYRTTLDLAIPTELGSVTRGGGFPGSPWIDAEMRSVVGPWMTENTVCFRVEIEFDYSVGPNQTQWRFITFPRAGGAGTDSASSQPTAGVYPVAGFPLSATETHAPVVTMDLFGMEQVRQSALGIKDDTDGGHTILWPANDEYGFNPTVLEQSNGIANQLWSLSKSADSFAAYMVYWDSDVSSHVQSARLVTGPADGPTERIEIQAHPSGLRHFPSMMFYRS